MIKCEKLSFGYENEDGTEKRILKNIDLEIKKGSFVAVLGRNGSGKSTLAKHFNAILTPTEGNVFINGINTKNTGELFNIRKSVGMVFQNPDNQIVATTVEEDIAFGLENLGIERGEMLERIDFALKCVNMEKYRKAQPHRLSGGQKQRVAIAGIMAMGPECIVLDEPTAMLDPKGRREVMESIRRLNREENITVVLITHFMEEAVKADRVIVMDNGSIKADGAPAFVFADVERIKALGLEVPEVTMLLYELKKMGVKIDGTALRSEECARIIDKLLKGQTDSD